MAISCESYEAFLKGTCSNCKKDTNICVKFGFHSQQGYNLSNLSPDSHVNPLYLLTSATRPFCLTHYKISIKMANQTVHDGDVGTLSIKLVTKNNRTSERINLNVKESKFDGGEIYSYFVTSNDIGGSVEKVKIVYDYKLNTIRLRNPEIYVEFFAVESMEHNSLVKICPVNGQPLVNGFLYEFSKYNCN